MSKERIRLCIFIDFSAYLDRWKRHCVTDLLLPDCYLLCRGVIPFRQAKHAKILTTSLPYSTVEQGPQRSNISAVCLCFAAQAAISLDNLLLLSSKARWA